MIPYLWRICILLTLIFVRYPVEGSSCTQRELTKIGGYCTAKMDCQGYVNFDLTAWSCIKHVRRNPNYDSYYNYNTRRDIVSYDDNYYLIINVKDPREIDPFPVSFENFMKLTIEDGDLIIIPQDVYKMKKLKEIYISGNKIGTVNFNKFLPMSLLSEIHLSHNTINVIDLEDDTEASLSSQLSNVKFVDISYNNIEVIPNSFLTHFTQLQHLNLSHNLIRSIGIHTFEGIVQLETLDMSDNRLIEVGNAFARFGNLRDLSISNNNLSKLMGFNFVTLTNLEKLNVSFNNIFSIDNNTFESLTKLLFLDLGHNQIEQISNQLFKSNKNLQSLSLLNNSIQTIEPNSFKDNRLIEFGIKNNHLTGSIEKHTFKGVNVNELNLSGGKLTKLKDEVFTDMFELKNLNISSNVISNISSLAFSSLVSLSILDLSNNQLNELNFETFGLKNLSKLYAHHNNIEKIIKNVFDNLVSLTELDLSFNDIKEIEAQSFLKIQNLELITLTGSHFVGTLETNVLQGLTSVEKMYMSGTRTTRFQNESFSGMTALTDVFSPFGQLAEIEYNAFLGTGSIAILTLSNNQLQSFHINTSTISLIQEIYLNNNNLRNISHDTFSYLSALQKLNLANNDIIQVSSDAFQYLNALINLDLSSNLRMNIVGNPFQNLSQLHSLSLQNIKTEITFENSSASAEVLDVQSCGISNIDSVFIFNVKDVNYLNLSMNEITTIDKDSFRDMPSLVSLDLSLNKIMYIQPGSFLHVKKLMILNLFRNNLPSIQFGVFDGTEILRDLNLSNNILSSFDVKLLPTISKLSLDDNIISKLNFKDFFDTEISELSIGGNQISCKILAELKVSQYSEKFKRIVTAKTLNYHSENVNGISCQTIPNDTPSVISVTDSPGINISPLISSIRNIMDKFSISLQTIGENSIKTEELTDEAKNVIKSLEDFIESSNTNQITNNEYLTKLTDINNNSNIQLGEIKKYLMNLTANKINLESDIASQGRKIMDDDTFNMKLEFQKMLKQETDALREEFKNALTSISKVPLHESLVAQNKDAGDTNTIFYFIAICLAIIVAAYIGNIIFSHVTRLRRSRSVHTRNSATPISNSIEME